MAELLAPAVAPLTTMDAVHAHIIEEAEALYLAYSERLLAGMGSFKVPTRNSPQSPQHDSNGGNYGGNRISNKR